MRRALVLGAGGFIGRRLCVALRAAGWSVAGFGRGAGDDPDHIVGELADTAAAVAAAEDRPVIFHLIGGRSPAAAEADPAADAADTVVASLRFLDGLRQADGGDLSGRRLVFVSSGGAVYGRVDRLPVPEDAPTDPIGAYGLNKLMLERHLLLQSRRHGLDLRIMRVANPFGEGQVSRQQQGVIAAFAAAAAASRPLTIIGDGATVRDYVHVDDVARALVLGGSADAPGAQTFNVGSGVGRSLNDVADAVERAVGRPLERLRAPPRPADVPAVALDIARARRLLGWAPAIDWETAVARACRWAAAQAETESAKTENKDNA